MLLWRKTFNVKQGCMDEAVAMVKESYEMWAGPGSSYRERSRLYRSFEHPDVLIHDVELESLTEFSELTAAWSPLTPEQLAYLEKWYTITERGATNEWLGLL